MTDQLCIGCARPLGQSHRIDCLHQHPAPMVAERDVARASGDVCDGCGQRGGAHRESCPVAPGLPAATRILLRATAESLRQLAGMLDETSRLLAGVEYAAERLANL